MTIYRVKYRKLGFLFDILSFFAFIAVLGTSALTIVYQHLWLNILYAGGSFIALKSLSKSILAIRIPISTSDMHNPIDGPEADIRNARLSAAASRPAHEPRLQVTEPPPYKTPNRVREVLPEEIPVLQEVIAEPEPEPALLVEEIIEPEQVPEPIAEPTPETKPENKTQKFYCEVLKEFDTEALPDKYDHLCAVDLYNLTLSNNDETHVIKEIDKTKIKKISYEEFRNNEQTQFKLLNWLAAGVVIGLAICLTLTIMQYNKASIWPSERWLFSTMLPIMALATFGGLFAGILIPHKKTRIHILYTLYIKSGAKIRFVTGYKGFKRARRAFADNGLTFIEA